MEQPPSDAPSDSGGAILLITSDHERPPGIRSALESHGFTLLVERQPERALRAALESQPRLVLLDAASAGAGTVPMVREIRNSTPVPLIVMSALRRPTDLVAALENGADDYVGGPSEPEEIVARVRAVLRRGSRRRPLAGEVIGAGGIRIEPAARISRVDGIAIELTAIEFDILEYLVREAGRTVSRDELMVAVCRREASPLDRSLDVHISHLRRKLHPRGPQIMTIRGVGYMFAASGRGGS